MKRQKTKSERTAPRIEDFYGELAVLDAEERDYERRNLSFAVVATVMDWSNVCSYLKDEVSAFLEECGLTDLPHVFMATHSWGGREWKLERGREPPFLAEPSFNGGWYVFTEKDVSYMACTSASSGSRLEATKQSDGLWTVTLSVPQYSGRPYKGLYWSAFHEAQPVPQAAAEAQVVTDDEVLETPRIRAALLAELLQKYGCRE